MDTVLSFLIDWGYWGMLAAAFLAGSFFPFSREAVMLALQAAGLNYRVARKGTLPWTERDLHVSPESIEKAERFMAGRGAWMGFFAFLPLLGSAITIALGLMRANVVISLISISLGKFLRYAVLVFGASLFI